MLFDLWLAIVTILFFAGTMVFAVGCDRLGSMRSPLTTDNTKVETKR